MKITSIETCKTVWCPKGAFVSRRLILADDNMGFGMTVTTVLPGEPYRWHYKNHLEACYCVQGNGILTDCATGEKHIIKPGKAYLLDNHDEHLFEAHHDPVTLVCVFNPPLTGDEVHQEDGSYAKAEV